MESSTTFVLDTNVLMRRSPELSAIKHFARLGDVVLPNLVVAELDGNKAKFDAREALRELSELFEGRWADAVSLDGHVVLIERRCTDPRKVGKVLRSLPQQEADVQILATAQHVQQTSPDKVIVVISNDRWVRWAANTLGLKAESWQPPKLHLGHRALVHGEYAIKRLRDGNSIELPRNSGLVYPNQPVKVKTPCEGSSILGFISAERDMIHPLIRGAYEGVLGVVPRDDHQRFALHALLSPEIPLVTIEGKAGAGKTLLTLAAAVWQLRNETYKRVLVTRPFVAAAEELGFLPGNHAKKQAPWEEGYRIVVDKIMRGIPTSREGRLVCAESGREFVSFAAAKGATYDDTLISGR